MATSLQRLDSINKPDTFDDQKDASSIAQSESNSEDLGQFSEAILSQLKRIIHGNFPGNWHDDPASVFGGDASLKSLFEGGDEIIRQDLQDNNVEYLIIGDITEDRKIVIGYSLELPIANRARTGTIVVNHDGVAVDVDDDYSYVGTDIAGLEITADINNENIRLIITTTNVGEHPTIRYRRTSIGVV